MGWHAQLALDYRACHGRTVLHFTHDGPLRVLKSLYPEGPAICHNVLVHPPGGLVGGDELDITVQVGAGAHALVTTPGAARFYKSNGQPARQRRRLRLPVIRRGRCGSSCRSPRAGPRTSSPAS